MEEKGLQEDPRYTQLLALRANSKHQHLSSNQMQQLRAQIMAYRLLARNQPLSKQLVSIAQGQRQEGAGGPPQQHPTPPSSPFQAGGPQQPQQPHSQHPQQPPKPPTNGPSGERPSGGMPPIQSPGPGMTMGPGMYLRFSIICQRLN
jgi:SWI/SNF-related matrix-associated actin-dependent regulator of chromatin subfamily A member 2/4